jgi:hypothetical protein
MNLNNKYLLKFTCYLLIWMLPLFLVPFERATTQIELLMWFWGALGGMILFPWIWRAEYKKSLPGILEEFK